MTPTATNATVRDILAPEPERAEVNRRLAKALTATAALGVVTAALAGEKTTLSMDTLVQGVTEQFYELLKMPVSEIALKAWTQSRDLLDAMEETEQSGDLAFVPLLDHSITSVQRPKIEVMMGARKLCTLDFAVELEIRLEGMRIKIAAGRIAGMMAAEIQAKGSIKYGDYVLAKKELEHVPIL